MSNNTNTNTNTNQFVIEKNIPITGRRGRTAGNSKYPFRNMEVGDSVVIPNVAPTAVRSSLNTVTKTAGFKFATRTLSPSECEAISTKERPVTRAVRVWRIAEPTKSN